MNPLLNGISNIPNIGQFKNIFQMIQYSRNPSAMLQKMIMNNPQAKEIMKYVDSCGGNYEQAFRSKAQEMGIDPDDFISNFR